MSTKRLKELYYITHIDNIPSILTRGILSHAQVEANKVEYVRVYDVGIVQNRKAILAPNGKSLWEFANVYFQPRNPMLYRVKHEKTVDNIAILAVRADILDRPDIFISTGNAASQTTEILPREEGMKRLPEMKKYINKTWWTEEMGTKRKIMAECLVPDRIPPEMIQSVFVASHTVVEKVKKLIRRPKLSIIPESHMFFLPSRQINLTPNLFLVEGDMFFSGMQSLTISVNTVGVMGKGLASRAKYQFPDAYVVYQDVCRKKILKMGKPYLYKRESSFDYQLADQPGSLSHIDGESWFVLFPTKKHWRNKSDIQGIEQGLQWIRDNYKQEGIKSLAVPALGCGLGKLKWEDVGPLMCQYLNLDIPVRIHLPMEEKLSQNLVSKKFLMK
ncbi:MAG: DUF4433 domain-containing protein [Planctomycetes bacterium]|nr:DUF4433 domain-containing protein [Planctomycetota bacterium]